MKLFAAPVMVVLLIAAAAAPAVASPGSAEEVRLISRDPAFATPCAEIPFGTTDQEAEFQPHLAVHPHFPERLATVWTQGLFISAVVGLSDDAGKTWRQVHVPVSRCSGGTGGFAADPWIEWGPDGTLYVAALTAFQAGMQATQVVVVRSEDGGRTWSRPVVVEDDGRRNDRETLAVDPNDPSRLYASWTKRLDDGAFAISLSESRDYGRTWSPSRIIYNARGGWPNGVSLEVLGDGTLLGTLQELYEGDVSEQLVLRSEDRGATWSVVSLGSSNGRWPADPDTSRKVIGNAVPTIDVAPDGDVLMAWQDATLPNQSTIWITRSRDNGVTWEPKIPVRTGAGQAWAPTLAAGPRDLIALTWYDTRADVPGDGRWSAEVWSAHAHSDDLSRWSETRLTEPFDLLQGFRSTAIGPVTLGNYFGLVPFADGFGATFSLPVAGDREAPQDIAFTKLVFPGGGSHG